jgi:hypothetical protein
MSLVYGTEQPYIFVWMWRDEKNLFSVWSETLKMGSTTDRWGPFLLF